MNFTLEQELAIAQMKQFAETASTKEIKEKLISTCREMISQQNEYKIKKAWKIE